MRPARLLPIMSIGLLCLTAASSLLSAEPAATTTAAEPSSKASSATTCPICGRVTDSASYSDKAGNTLVRGASNTFFGWTELLRQPVQEVKAGGNAFVGIGKGVGEGVKRTFAGLGEVLTFWTPKSKDGYLQFSKDCPICMKSTR